jgi:pimeloyl-ACP methyl ester carboxylesterase
MARSRGQERSDRGVTRSRGQERSDRGVTRSGVKQPPPDPSVTRIAGPWRHMDVHANGIRFHVVEANPHEQDSTHGADLPLVILLHGFGSFWWSWRHQLRGLSGARVVAVDLRGYGGSDKPPRGYDGWTPSVLHPRVVRAIAVVSSPHPVALRASALTRRDQGRALLPSMLRYQLPIWPERSLTRDDAAELEIVVRTRAGAGWLASEDFSQTVHHMRRAIQIPSAAHSALEYQRWAVRSQLRGEGRRFMRSMKRPLSVPVLHMRGDADPYVLADPVHRTERFAPQGRYVSIAGCGHFAHEEDPDLVNAELTRFLAGVYGG